MDYEKKLNRMATHIRDHPADYQTKISYLINYSRMIEKLRREDDREAEKGCDDRPCERRGRDQEET